MARKSHAHVIISSRRVPKMPGPQSHGVRVDAPGAALYTSQLLPLEMPKGAPSTGPIRAQADLVFAHLRQVVQDGGFTLDQVVQVTLYVTTLKNQAIVEELYGKLFFTLAQPARSVVVVQGLPSEALIAVQAVAVKAAAAAPQAAPQDFMGMDDESMY